MDNLVAWLTRIDDQALGTVVHIGAGAGAVVDQYAALPSARRPRQVVLIEGDPDLAGRLERAAAAHAWARVLPTPVAAQAGPVPWNRFNLPMLNGPLDATALTAAYPRLRRVQATTVRCEALADVLGLLGLKPGGEDRLVDVLVFDVPGQEAALLAALSPDLLRRFHALLLRGCRSALRPSGQAADAALALLARQHFKPVARDSERDTMWPAALLRFDVIGHELAQLRLRGAEMAATLKERDRVLGGMQTQIATLTQANATIDTLAAERRAKIVERDERIAEMSAALAQAKAAADKLATELRAKIVERDERIRLLDAQLADSNLRVELLQQEVLKAEGQLALVKELLLKEPTL